MSMTGDQIMDGFGGSAKGTGKSFDLNSLSGAFGGTTGGGFDFSNPFSSGLSFLGSSALDGLKGISSGFSKGWDASGMKDLTSNMDAKDWTATGELVFNAYNQFLGPQRDYTKALTNNINKQNAIADQTIKANENSLMKDELVNKYYGW